MSHDKKEDTIHVPKEPVSPCGNKVDAIFMCPVVDLQLLLQRRVDQDDNLAER
jgi:hypothetical protein